VLGSLPETRLIVTAPPLGGTNSRTSSGSMSKLS
jgi:hypothetical protein